MTMVYEEGAPGDGGKRVYSRGSGAVPARARLLKGSFSISIPFMNNHDAPPRLLASAHRRPGGWDDCGTAPFAC